MKKAIAAFCSSILFVTLGLLPTGAGASQSGISVTLNGKAISFTQAPQLVNGRVLVPYRPIAEAIGAGVRYDAATKTVAVTKDSNNYLLPLTSKTATINGTQVALDVPAVLVSGQTFVPLRFVSENLGLGVQYHQDTRTVALTHSTAPAFSILAPKQGEMLHGDKVTVALNVFNHQLSDFKTHMQPKAGEGHVHIWLDTDANDPKVAYKMTKQGQVVFDNVKPGPHTLTIQLVGNDHKPIKPEVKQVITFTTMAAGHAASSGTLPSPSAEGTSAVKTYHMDLANYSFSPETLTIEAGAKVVFSNKDDVEHTVTADDGSFDSGLFGKGKTYEMTFAKAGVYKIHCKPHDRMVATIVVK